MMFKRGWIGGSVTGYFLDASGGELPPKIVMMENPGTFDTNAGYRSSNPPCVAPEKKRHPALGHLLFA